MAETDKPIEDATTPPEPVSSSDARAPWRDTAKGAIADAEIVGSSSDPIDEARPEPKSESWTTQNPNRRAPHRHRGAAPGHFSAS